MYFLQLLELIIVFVKQKYAAPEPRCWKALKLHWPKWTHINAISASWLWEMLFHVANPRDANFPMGQVVTWFTNNTRTIKQGPQISQLFIKNKKRCTNIFLVLKHVLLWLLFWHSSTQFTDHSEGVTSFATREVCLSVRCFSAYFTKHACLFSNGFGGRGSPAAYKHKHSAWCCDDVSADCLSPFLWCRLSGWKQGASGS